MGYVLVLSGINKLTKKSYVEIHRVWQKFSGSLKKSKHWIFSFRFLKCLTLLKFHDKLDMICIVL